MLPVQVNIMDHDEEQSKFPRWTLSLHNQFTTYHTSTARLHLEWSTRTDGKWGGRANLNRHIDIDLTSEEIESLVNSAISIQDEHPHEILDDTQVHTHGGSSPTRANKDSAICRSVSLWRMDGYSTFYIRKDSIIWNGTLWGKEIVRLVAPHYQESSWLMKPPNRKIP